MTGCASGIHSHFRSDSIVEIKRVLNKSASPFDIGQRSDDYELTPLHAAAGAAYIEGDGGRHDEPPKIDAVKMLVNIAYQIDAGSTTKYIYTFKNTSDYINAKTKDGYTALHFAVLRGDYDTAKYLIDNGADVNAKANELNVIDRKGMTPLHYAAGKANINLVSLLLDSGANPKEEIYTFSCPTPGSSPHDIPLSYFTTACRDAMKEYAMTQVCNWVDDFARVEQNCLTSCGDSQCVEGRGNKTRTYSK